MCAGGEAILLLRTYHMLTDFWSTGIIARELQLLYHAESVGKTLSLPQVSGYLAFAKKQKKSLNSALSDDLWHYWVHKLQTANLTLDLPHDYPPLKKIGFKGKSLSFTLEKETIQDLRLLGKETNTTLFTLLLTIYSIFLQRYTNQDDILIGTPALGREEARYWSSVGYFVNVIVIRAILGKVASFKELLMQLHSEVKASLAHQGLPFSRLVERLQPEQNRGRSPFNL